MELRLRITISLADGSDAAVADALKRLMLLFAAELIRACARLGIDGVQEEP